MSIPINRVTWRPCWRIIPSRFPPIDLFERVADPADLDAVLALESLTNDRVREEVGNIQLIPPEDRVSGPRTSYICYVWDGTRISAIYRKSSLRRLP